MLLSRVADSLYWIGRYLERAEHAMRLVDVRLDLGVDRRRDGWDFEGAYARLGLLPADVRPRNPAALIDAVVFDMTNRGSVAACVTSARENARQVREEISADMWRQINELFLRLTQARPGVRATRPHYLSRLVIDGVHLFQGVTDATMGHGEGWQYLQVGKFLERAASTAAVLDLHFGLAAASLPSASSTDVAPGDRVEWIALLRSCGALEAYSRHYTADVQPRRMAEFLLLNAEFPRSARFAASHVESGLRALALLTGRPAGGQAERMAGRLHALLGYGLVDEILQDPHAYLDGLTNNCALVHNALHQTYITYRIESALPA
jgi:uncharacterized alpha-E superfamily protein